MKKKISLIFVIIIFSVFFTYGHSLEILDENVLKNNKSMNFVNEQCKKAEIGKAYAINTSDYMKTKIEYLEPYRMKYVDIRDRYKMYRVRDILPLEAKYNALRAKDMKIVAQNKLKLATRYLAIDYKDALFKKELSNKKLENSLAIKEDFQKKYELELISDYELLEAEYNYEAALVDYNIAERKYNLKREIFKNHTGLEDDFIVELEKPLDIDVSNKDELYKKAFENRYEIKDILRRIELNNEEIDFNIKYMFINLYQVNNYEMELENAELEQELKILKEKIKKEINENIEYVNLYDKKIINLENLLDRYEKKYNDLIDLKEIGKLNETEVNKMEFFVLELRNNLEILKFMKNIKSYELFYSYTVGGSISEENTFDN